MAMSMMSDVAAYNRSPVVQVVESVAGMRAARATFGGRVGFVPTMGYLHQGHVALVQRARAENDHVVVSIFVNPTQFGAHEDLARYPRDFQRDIALLQDAGVDLVFAPAVAEVYPPGFCTSISLGALAERLEGVHRSGHFQGVATVVCKLFNMVAPQRAYFGQKDAQQTVIVRRLVADLDMPVAVVVCPTVREPDGLAMSSRNVYLGIAERQAATVLVRALRAAAAKFDAGERDAEVLRGVLRGVLATEPLAVVEYTSVADPATLEELMWVGEQALVSLAVRIGTTRLIDNVILVV